MLPEDFNINDTYKIKKDWEEIKKLVQQIDDDLELFLSHKKVKKRGVRARVNIFKLKNKMLLGVAKKILKTKQDYDGDYS